jgi:hypothetical protein
MSTIEAGSGSTSVSRVPDSSIPMEIATSAAQAGAYELVGEEFFVEESCPDPVLVRTIQREVDPRYVPLRCKRIYRSPAGSLITRVYHVIGRYIPEPRNEGSAQYVRLSHVPRNFHFPTNKIQPLRTLWAPWEKDTVEYEANYPPAEVEYGPWVVESMRALRQAFDGAIALETSPDGSLSAKQRETTRDKINEILNAEARRDEEMLRTAREEMRYRIRHNWKHLKNAADEGRWTEPPSPAKPFVDLGSNKKGA